MPAERLQAAANAELTFDANAIIYNGITIPVKYSTDAAKTLFIESPINGDVNNIARVTISPSDAHYQAAYSAAFPAANNAPKPFVIANIPVADAQMPTYTPDKPFANTEIPGDGWRIVFSGQYNRTMVIFNRSLSDAEMSAVHAAGFYYSKHTRSWQRKLTTKAFRAAQALAQTLHDIRANAPQQLDEPAVGKEYAS